MKPLITIFTPTYNRAHLLSRLYNSLKSQKNKNFEWIIVDDGSTDNTLEIIQSFKNDNIFPIIYVKKVNEGKHIAINMGIKLAKGNLFFIVDSDDFLTEYATSLIEDYFHKINQKSDIAGVSFRRGYSSTEFIGSKYFKEIICNVFDFRYRYSMVGDMAEVYKTDIIKKYSFPSINNEKFCPESLVWNRIGLNYKMLWTSHIIYIGEYLTDGLTSKMDLIRKKSPSYSLIYYSELQRMPIPLLYKIRANINFWRFAKYSKKSFLEKFKKTDYSLSLIGMPIGFIYNLIK